MLAGKHHIISEEQFHKLLWQQTSGKTFPLFVVKLVVDKFTASNTSFSCSCLDWPVVSLLVQPSAVQCFWDVVVFFFIKWKTRRKLFQKSNFRGDCANTFLFVCFKLNNLATDDKGATVCKCYWNRKCHKVEHENVWYFSALIWFFSGIV